MSILLFSPFLKYGGAEKQFCKIREVFDANNIEYETLSIDGAIIPRMYFWVRLLFKYLSVDVKSEKYYRLVKLPLYYMLFSMYVAIKGYDKVYAYSLYCLPGLFLLKIVSVVTFRSVEIIYSERIFNGFVEKSLKLPFIYYFFDVVVVNSDELYSKFSAAGVRNVKLIRNYVDVVDGYRCTDFSVKGGELNVAVVARINKEKNQLYILKELENLDFVVNNIKVRVNLYGEVDDESYFGEIRRYLNNFPVLHVKSKPLLDIYSENDLVCLPSLSEGTSNVLLEAMINKKDFLCSDIASNLQIPISSASWFSLVEGGFINKVNEFINKDEGLRSKVRYENYNLCVGRYGFSEYSKNILQLFK